ncbi:hypothetical protein PHYBLDRAFT_151118 [Phycomyces blakesleeanus NRRL 1555(-)]|uniref:Uncharacterized protein n=1 Tax=Phycomyces blakesleeanus (strain ATCC 8743b / DSM 1359 / FGSC 10004 / NBRC 33097 / NRRL 1555) TaxID=763407 RepID=A0A167KAH1_PHYB8|nr:hypothetical protein PHYBLDRAFT_151118 [Phycomyces blakesleeanus NRRL 1555(-)]OAD67605.1 hypothetical protein PHYBLDRAFT_151118 [Phycomyces blakesleeanus NRRL 1555(-)]|eukprot:XP_018285645.1 hypothetical protein PHYBLDRAFT_151118 [Phycomyces blakesleeanus NRRL 1555(-)]
MLTLLPSSVKQGMLPDLTSFLRNMQAQFISLQQHTNELESLAATNARSTAQLAPRPPFVQRVAASVRMFAISTGPKGYQYVYILRSHHFTHREVRNSLKILGVDTGYILDINFPTKECKLEEVAAELHSNRCLKALKYLCPHVAVSVSHFFCDQDWISKEDIPVHSVSGPGASIHDF